MIGQNNTTTPEAKPLSILKRPTLVGNYAMSASLSSGYFSAGANVLTTLPAGHGFGSKTPNTVVGTAEFQVFNTTQKTKQRVSLPLRYFVAVGNSVFFAIGKIGNNATRWDNIGLTMPSSGDVIKIKCSLNLRGYMSIGAFKQTLTTP